MGIRPTLVKGTKENLAIEVVDRLGNLTDLTGTNATFDVRKRDAGNTWLIQGQAATVDVMTAFCFIDTTPGGFVEDVYELYLNFTNLPEMPRLGPHLFEVAYS